MPHARLDLHDPCGRDLGRGRIWDAGDSSVFSKSLAISAIWKIILENHTGIYVEYHLCYWMLKYSFHKEHPNVS